MAEEHAPKPRATPDKDVFISYASADRAVADAVCTALESAGVPCWIAPRNVTPGAFYAESIVHAIDDTRIIVLVLSKNSADSQHVLREVERASSRRHPVISLRIDTEPLPAGLEYFLNSSQWLDAAATGVDRSLPKLVDAVKVALSLSTASTLAAPAPPAITRSGGVGRPALIALAVVVTAALAFLAVNRFRLSRHAQTAQPATSEASTVAALSDKSIAVLPFADMSEKKDQEYFADGMAEEILNLLVTIPHLKVIGRTSSFQFKGRTDDLQKIGSVLGAAYVVEGSVRRSGNHVRVTAQLIDTRSGAHRWSESYDRDVSDILKVQGEIAAALVRALQLEVAPSIVLTGRSSVRNAEAYDLYLRGLHAKDRYEQSGLEEAVANFRHAMALDPGFITAAESLAVTLDDVVDIGYVSPQKGWDQARAAAEAVFKLDPHSAIAHAVLGNVHTEFEWDWPAADREFKMALALAPNTPYVLDRAAVNELAIGKWSDALEHLESASTNDPLYADVFMDKMWTYQRMGRLSEAEQAGRRVLEIAPTSAWAHWGIGLTMLLEGRPADALIEMQRETREEGKLSGLAVINCAMNHEAEAHALIGKLEGLGEGTYPMGIAEAYAYCGQKNRAFFWLDKAFLFKDAGLHFIKGDPLLRNLEGDPRYGAFLRKMNLPE